MNFSFKRATKHAAKLRLAFVGPAGSGKTYCSLSVAKGLGGRIALIDSERGSASKYADIFEFDVLELESFAPETYVRAIRAAEAAGYDTIIIDSLSHVWFGREGALEMVDNYSRKSRENSFAAWRHVTPKHNEMVDAIVGSRCHVIATMRSKTEWIVEKDPKTGKSVPKKIGLAPVQRDGLEYEFDVVGDLDIENTFTITKTRCPALTGKLVERPGEEMAQVLTAWLDGVPRPADEPKPAASSTAPDNVVPLQQPATGQELDAAPGTDQLEQRLRSCASAQEFGALVADIKRLPEGERKDRLRAVYAELRAARAASEPAQGGAA